MKNFILLLILMFFVTQSQALYITLGTDEECDFNSDSTTIQNLIDSDYDEIRITNQSTYIENLYVPKSKLIIGGYANCDDAHNDIVTSESIIDGNDTYSVITFASENDIRNISTLENLELINGLGADYTHGGGITVNEDSPAGLSLTLDNVTISENKAFYGGGLFVKGTYNVQVYIQNSLILKNTATINGGGIYCDDIALNLNQNTGVRYNKIEPEQAFGGDGGGIYSDDCNIVLRTASRNTLTDLNGISHNKATGNGGGIYMRNNSVLSADYRAEPYPVNINNNSADSDNDGIGQGGGIFAQESHVYMYGSTFKSNSAASGAALAIVDNSEFTSTSRLNYCWNRSKCNEYSNNFTTSNGGKGGVMYINNSEAIFAFTRFFENHADLGIILNAESNSSVSITQSTIFKNGEGGDSSWNDNYLYRFVNSDLEILNSTSADNDSSSASFRFFNSPYKIYNSIFHNPSISSLSHSQGSLGELKCVITRDTSGIQNTSNVVMDDPLFVDRENNDYHLSVNSPAIDLCDNEHENVNLYVYDLDMDGDLVGWDDPTITDVMGIVDAGSDESYIGDIIFSSSF